MAVKPSDIMIDYAAYMKKHNVTCAIEGLWEGIVDWEGAPSGRDWHFIIGMGHCGSSVLTRILNLHPEVYSANEDNTVLNLISLFASKTVLTAGRPAFAWYNRPWGDHAHPFASEVRNVTAGYIRDFAEVWRGRVAPGVPFVGDKHVWYLLHRDRLRKIFPGVRFIYCLRHPLAQLSAMIHDGWAGNDALAHKPDIAWTVVRRLVRSWHELSAETDVSILQYERLANLDTIRWEIKHACLHLGVDPDGILPSDLEQFAGPQFNRDWREDEAILSLADEWQAKGLASQEQMLQLLTKGDEYRDAITSADWSVNGA